MSEANRERSCDDGVRISAVAGKGVHLVRKYERMEFSKPMLPSVTRR